MNFIIWILIGAAAGWFAGKMMKGGGFGFLMNMLLGVAGSFVGGFCFSLIGLEANSMIGSLVTAAAGAMIILWVAGKLKS